MGAEVLLNLGLIEAALRQQRSGDGAESEQEQQHQGGAHRCERTPQVRQDGHQIGNLASLTNASRTHEMKSFHSPVSRARPTAISIRPPKI